jgi:hypothetical protein
METSSHTEHEHGAGDTRTYSGSCHCGAVQFRVTADLGKGGGRCNCSICTKVGQIGGLVKPEAFQLISSEENLSSYEWASRTSQRYFCKRCGVHCFARGHLDVLGGDYVSVNYNCLDGVELRDLPIIYWDGRHNNWAAGPRPTAWAIL